MAGGCSWTKYWLTFDNSYYSRIDQLFNKSLLDRVDNANTPCSKYHDDHDDEPLLWLPTDQALYDSPEFHPYFIKYARNQQIFFQDYSIAHKKMSELGAKFRPVGGIQLENRVLK